MLLRHPQKVDQFHEACNDADIAHSKKLHALRPSGGKHSERLHGDIFMKLVAPIPEVQNQETQGRPWSLMFMMFDTCEANGTCCIMSNGVSNHDNKTLTISDSKSHQCNLYNAA